MKLLVLGGTVFVGRHVVAAAQAAGHAVTIFHRGRTSAPPGPVESLHGDRDGNVDALRDRTFDAVIDCSGYTPEQLLCSGSALDGVAHYLFVSTRSVYRRFPPRVDVDEHAPVLEGRDGYGALKARAEEAIAAVLPGRTTIVRPGLIVGPHDPTGRFTYWPLRVHRGGDVLAPGRPGRAVQCVDARDLARWCVALVARPPSGVYDVVGPSTTMGALLDTAHRTIGGDLRLHWMDDATLIANGVEPWTGMPLWIPESDPDFGGLMHGAGRRAAAAGMTSRPLADTVRDTLAWALGESGDGATNLATATPRAVATMTPQREQALLSLLAERAADPAP